MKAVYKNSEFEYSFWVYIPDDLKENEKLPLMLFLHGAGERGENLDSVLTHGLPKYFKQSPPVRAIMVAPQCPTGITWINQIEKLKIFFDKIIATYPIDTDKVTLTGISMGGFGTWEFAMTYPEMFAAIAPICGGGQAWRCDSLLHMPIRTFHGSKDSVVSPNYSYAIVDRLIAMGGTPEFTIFYNVDHNSWEPAYEKTDLICWLVKQTKKEQR